jgi:hypothetical protein
VNAISTDPNVPAVMGFWAQTILATFAGSVDSSVGVCGAGATGVQGGGDNIGVHGTSDGGLGVQGESKSNTHAGVSGTNTGLKSKPHSQRYEKTFRDDRLELLR